MLRFEGEYKYYFKSILSSRFGLAGFAGVGFVFGGRSRVGIDMAYGREDVFTMYFALNEAI